MIESLNKRLTRQEGFTLIEIIIGIAVSSLLLLGINTGIYQIFRVSNLNSAHVAAVKQVENALFYINRDIQMSQKVETNVSGNWLRLNWTGWDDNSDNVITYILNNSVITRKYYVNDSLADQKQIASKITAVSAVSPGIDEEAWTIEISSTAASANIQADETRQMKIIPRPGS
jgi:prepilin-type N-terminal cleavage/methylation domain-containing protein